MGRYWLVLCGTGSVSSGTGLVKGSYACIYQKNGDLVGCHHSGTDERTNKQGKMKGLRGLRGLTRRKYSPSFLECLSHQDSENIAHC